MAFVFEYVAITNEDAGCGTWTLPGDQQWTIFGRLVEGRIELGEPVLLPTSSDVPFRGYVARFAESFTGWLGLPFYDSVTPDSVNGTFCVCIGAAPGEPGIASAGTARSEE